MNAIASRPDILTNSGQYFDFEFPERYRFDILDIAKSLSKICRFGGQCFEFYSVAQHSVEVSYIVPEEFAFAGLMHDAAEAFIGDMPRPLKLMLADYRAVEKRVEAALFEKIGLSLPLPRCVKEADLVMLATEQRDLMPQHDDEWAVLSGVSPRERKIDPLDSTAAYFYFIDRYEDLRRRIDG